MRPPRNASPPLRPAPNATLDKESASGARCAAAPALPSSNMVRSHAAPRVSPAPWTSATAAGVGAAPRDGRTPAAAVQLHARRPAGQLVRRRPALPGRPRRAAPARVAGRVVHLRQPQAHPGALTRPAAPQRLQHRLPAVLARFCGAACCNSGGTSITSSAGGIAAVRAACKTGTRAGRWPAAGRRRNVQRRNRGGGTRKPQARTQVKKRSLNHSRSSSASASARASAGSSPSAALAPASSAASASSASSGITLSARLCSSSSSYCAPPGARRVARRRAARRSPRNLATYNTARRRGAPWPPCRPATAAALRTRRASPAARRRPPRSVARDNVTVLGTAGTRTLERQAQHTTCSWRASASSRSVCAMPAARSKRRPAAARAQRATCPDAPRQTYFIPASKQAGLLSASTGAQAQMSPCCCMTSRSRLTSRGPSLAPYSSRVTPRCHRGVSAALVPTTPPAALCLPGSGAGRGI
jgi:hypothetical protein